MDKMGNKDDKNPYVHTRTQLMAAVRSDAKLTNAFTTLAYVKQTSQRKFS